MDKEDIQMWYTSVYMYTYTMKYYSAIKKNEILLFAATWMDLEGIMISECQRETNTVWYHLYVESKKYNKLVNIAKKKQTHRYREQTSGYQWGEVGGAK